MADGSDIRHIRSAARILLICPQCGQENAEFADTLRALDSYACAGDDCSFSFDLAGPRRGEGKGFIETCKKFYAAFYMLRGQGAR
jgi:hypothetical protein